MQPRNTAKLVSNEDRQNAIQTLLGLGVDLDEARAHRLLERYDWDIDQAASSLFTETWEQPPPVSYQPLTTGERPTRPIAQEPDSTVATQGSQTQDYRSRSPSRSREAAPWKGQGYGSTTGALNSSTALVLHPSSARQAELVDLTGDENDEDLKRAMAESMQDITMTHQRRANTPAVPSITVYGPKNRGEEQVIVPSQPVGGHAGLSQDERDLSQALEASLSSSMQADVYSDAEPEKRIRAPGFPVALRTRSLKNLAAAYVLQALFAVPQICEAFASWRSHLPPSDPHTFDHYIEEDRARQYEKVSMLQKLFTFMDLTQESSFNIDNIFPTLELPEVLPHNPASDDLLSMVDQRLAMVIERVFCHSNGIPSDVCPPSSTRLLAFRKGITDNIPPRPDYLSAERDHATLAVLGIASEDEPNTLESAIYSLMLKPPIPEFFTHTSATICFLINRPEGSYSSSLMTPFSYPARLFLDPYMYENMEYVNQKRDEGDAALQRVEGLVKKKESLTKRDGTDTLANMRKVIYYLEHVAAGREDPARAYHLDSLATKLKTVLSECEAEVKNIDNEIRNAQQLKVDMFNSPQLRKHPYDLRAVLVHDGLIGREHLYAYLKSPTSGKWFKTCDATATEVSTETVLNDSSGLHLNAGPYLLVYSRAMDHPLPSPLRWPTKIRHEVRAMNNDFRAELPPELASQLAPEPTTLSPSTSVIRKSSKRSGGSRSAHTATASSSSTDPRDRMDVDPPV